MKCQKMSLIVLSLLVLASCASYVTSNVSIFENWNDSADKSYTFETISPDNLETRTYQKLVADELNQNGFILSSQDEAHFLIKIDYGSREMLGNVLQTIWPPASSKWPYGCNFNQSCVHQWNMWSSWDNMPQWVNTPYLFEEAFLKLLIIRQSDQKEVYRAIAYTDVDNLPLVLAMPYLARSVLQGFPRQNGSVVRIKLPRNLN